MVQAIAPVQNAPDAFWHRRLVPRPRGDQDDSPEGRNPSRPSGQASLAVLFRPTEAIRPKAPYRLDTLPHPPAGVTGRRILHLLGSPAVAPLARGFPV